MYYIIVAFVAAFTLTTVNGQDMQCPDCTDPFDPNSCTQIQNCTGGHDVCEFHVHTAFNNTVEYTCINANACANHETNPCDPVNHESCAYCCSDLDECKALRDQLFTDTYTTYAPSG